MTDRRSVIVNPRDADRAARAIFNDGSYWQSARRAASSVMDSIAVRGAIDRETLIDFGVACHVAREDPDLKAEDREVCGRVADEIANALNIRTSGLLRELGDE